MKTKTKFSAIVFGVLLLGLQACTHADREEEVLPEPTPEEETQAEKDLKAYNAASAVNGSKLYNDFTATETGFVAPANITLTDITSRKDFYRCKQCHAWDQKARYGSYINRAATTTRPDVSSAQLTNLKYADISVLFAKIKKTGGAAVSLTRTADGTNPSLGGNNHPDYGLILTDALIWDLVKFLREGAFNTEELYTISTSGAYPTGTRTYSNLGMDGDAAAGDVFFASKCSGCHDTDGTGITLGGKTLGDFTRTNPHEVQHKVVSGQLGSSMGATPITLGQMKDLLKALDNTTNYPN
ncbi:MAG: hypothetical protein A3K10_11455 [Bacteroidetes bacterium RIFCSPLOWO2_12_FULL_31_6]|nr:MAG: hypothetical protein A3K10_11455 [Bacteroidetes bacterium RIFCSPLOWO2_12_FULL_31_6]